jgi:hypothetical protein
VQPGCAADPPDLGSLCCGRHDGRRASVASTHRAHQFVVRGRSASWARALAGRLTPTSYGPRTGKSRRQNGTVLPMCRAPCARTVVSNAGAQGGCHNSWSPVHHGDGRRCPEQGRERSRGWRRRPVGRRLRALRCGRDGRAARARHGAVARVRPRGALPGAAPGGRSAGDRLLDRARAVETVCYVVLAIGWLVLAPLGEVMSAGPGTASPAGVRLGSLIIDSDATSAVLTLVFCLGAVMFYVLLYRSRSSPAGSRCGVSWRSRSTWPPTCWACTRSSASTPPRRTCCSAPWACRRWCWRPG